MRQYRDFDPFDLLEELAKQHKEMAKTLGTLIETHNNLAEAYHSQNQRLQTQAMLITHLQNKLNAISLKT